jgi:hypothetical protein
VQFSTKQGDEDIFFQNKKGIGKMLFIFLFKRYDQAILFFLNAKSEPAQPMSEISRMQTCRSQIAVFGITS